MLGDYNGLHVVVAVTPQNLSLTQPILHSSINPLSAFIFGPARYLCAHLCAFLVFLRTFLRIFSPHPPLAGQIPPQNPCKSVKSTVIFHFFWNFFRTFTLLFFEPNSAIILG